MLRKPVVWLFGQMLFLFLVMMLTGKLNLGLRIDSYSYLETARLTTAVEMLTSIRTIGYPLFLKVVALLAPDLKILPYLQFLIHVVAVLLFWQGLRSLGFAPVVAVTASSPLLYLRAFVDNVSLVSSEGLAIPMAVLTIGFLLLTVSRPGRILYWLGLGVGLFATYQARPAFLFLIPLVPLLGVIFKFIYTRELRWRRSHSAYLAALLLVAALPFLVFCGMRYSLVGHFGLVSFGGHNIAGLTSQMLSEDIVDHLPEKVRPLARSIIDRRSGHARYGISDCARRSTWGEDIKYDRWAICYGYFPWGLNYPAAKDVYGADNVKIDEGLSALAIAVIKEKPKVYLEWLARGLLVGIGQLFRADYLVAVLAGCIVGWGCLKSILSVFGKKSRRNIHGASQELPMEISLLATLAIGFFLSGLLLVIMVEPALGRYVNAVAIFIPSCLGLVLYRSITSE